MGIKALNRINSGGFDDAILKTVTEILAEVKTKGDVAVKGFTEKYDGKKLKRVEIRFVISVLCFCILNNSGQLFLIKLAAFFTR